MEAYYSDEAVTLYLGDSDGTYGGAPLLGEFAAGQFDAIVTDPPYNVSPRNGRDGTTHGKLKRKDGTSRKVQRDFGDWDRTDAPTPTRRRLAHRFH
jgi:DNA modification methylase